MTGRILCDAGPLVALLSTEDEHHGECAATTQRLRLPLLTCWPVVTEAAWLLRRRPKRVQLLLDGFRTGLLELGNLDADAMPWMAAFLRRHEKLGAQLADAALVYLAEREGIDTIFTLDRRDFSVYRLSGGRSLKPLP